MSETHRETSADTCDGKVGAKASESITATDLLSAMRDKGQMLTSLLLRLVLQGAEGTLGATAAAPSYHMMPDIIKSIAGFDGDGDAASAKNWLKSLQTTASLHQWPEAFRLEAAKCHLVRPLKDWLRSRSEMAMSWTSLEYHFRRTFCGQTQAAEKRRKMQERVQQRNLSTMAYFHAKVRLRWEANLDICAHPKTC